MDGNRLDLHSLVEALDAKRRAEGLSWREVARQAQVSASTLTRMQQKKRPDIDTFAALISWLDAPAERFFSGTRAKPARAGAATSAQNQRSKRKKPLSPEAAKLMSDLLQAAHRMAKELQD